MVSRCSPFMQTQTARVVVEAVRNQAAQTSGNAHAITRQVAIVPSHVDGYNRAVASPTVLTFKATRRGIT